jgi:hypothetical protein
VRSTKLSTLLARPLRVFALVIVTSLLMTTQSYASYRAVVYNPMSLSSTTVSTYQNHPVHYFAGWSNRYAQDINSPGETPNAPIYLWGAGWSTAQVKMYPEAPFGWTSYSNPSCTNPIGTEYTMAMVLNLPNGQTAGVGLSHLSSVLYAAGSSVSPGAHVANLSWLSSGGWIYAIVQGLCKGTSSGPHIHVESARTGTTFANGHAGGGSGAPSWDPYWYYDYP